MDRLAVSHLCSAKPPKYQSAITPDTQSAIENKCQNPTDETILDFKKPQKELTILFYMNGEYGDFMSRVIPENMLSIEKSSFDNKDINIVTQIGRVKPGNIESTISKDLMIVDNNWEGIRRYEVKRREHKELNSLANLSVDDLLEIEKQIPDNPILLFEIAQKYGKLPETSEKSKYYIEKAFDIALKDGFCLRNSNIKKNEEHIQKEADYMMTKMDEFFKKSSAYCPEKLNNKFSSTMIQNLGKNTGMDVPEQLENFIEFGLEKYPAKHYMVVIAAHGAGFEGVSGMSPNEVASAFESGIKKSNKKTGRKDKIDVIVFNSCLMGSLESEFEMKNSSDISLVSEDKPYASIFLDWQDHINNIQKNIDLKKSFDPYIFAFEYIEYYRNMNINMEHTTGNTRYGYPTLSAINHKMMDNFVDSWKELLDSCRVNGVSDKQLFTIIKNTKSYGSRASKDIGSIIDNIKTSDEMPEPVRQAAEKSKEAFKQVILYEQHNRKTEGGSQGLTVWAPTNYVEYFMGRDKYTKQVPDFSNYIKWEDFIGETAERVPKKVKDNCKEVTKELKVMLDRITGKNLSPGDRDKLIEQINEILVKNREKIKTAKEQSDFANL
jgi:hypothetical protein